MEPMLYEKPTGASSGIVKSPESKVLPPPMTHSRKIADMLNGCLNRATDTRTSDLSGVALAAQIRMVIALLNSGEL